MLQARDAPRQKACAAQVHVYHMTCPHNIRSSHNSGQRAIPARIQANSQRLQATTARDPPRVARGVSCARAARNPRKT